MENALLPLLLGALGLAGMTAPAIRQRLAAAHVQRRLAAACAGDHGMAPRRRSLRTAAQALLVRLGRPLLRNPAKAAELVAELRAAAFWHPDAAPAFVATRLLLMAVGALAGAAQAPGLSRAVLCGLIGAIIGYLAANRTLRWLAARRSRRLRTELPAAIDLVALAFEGGAGIEQALRFAGTQPVHPAPTVQRMLRLFSLDIDRGTPYELAIGRLGDRLGIEEAQMLNGLLQQSLQHGTELIAPLKALGRELRERRVADARAAIGRATTQMTVVMVTCLLPALMILIGAPSVSAILEVLGRFR